MRNERWTLVFDLSSARSGSVRSVQRGKTDIAFLVC
jgi:hypothetical protein